MLELHQELGKSENPETEDALFGLLQSAMERALQLPNGKVLGLGVDCEEISRWQRLLPKLSAEPDCRLFSQTEHAQCASAKDSAARYAGRWSAKEAVLKALGSRQSKHIDLRKIEVLTDDSGVPHVYLSEPITGAEIYVSITHTGSLALAVAVMVST